MDFPWVALLLTLASLLATLFARYRERRFHKTAAIVSETPVTSLAELKRALRLPHAQRAANQTGLDEGAAPVERLRQGHCQVTVLNLAGVAVWGPAQLELSATGADLQREVAQVLDKPPDLVNLLHGTLPLRQEQTLAGLSLEAGSDVHLTAVINAERREIADALFAHARGTLQVPENGWVTAPFTGQHVAHYETRLVRLYDEWVTTWERRCVKSGRAASGDDPGSDSEYEDVQKSSWEPREEILDRRRVTAAHIRLDDGSGVQAQLAPQDLESWAAENAEETFCHTDDPPREDLGIGRALNALVRTQRERGMRREERCLKLGEEVEAVGEALCAEDCVLLQELQRPSEQLHRVNSLTQDIRVASALAGKRFIAAALRHHQSLEQMHLGPMRTWRRLKWLLVVLSAFLMVRAFRQLRRLY